MAPTPLCVGVSATLGLSYVAGILPQTSVWAPERGRCRRRSGRGTGDLQSCCGVMASTDRFRPRSWRSACQRMLGARSRGGRVRRTVVLALCPRARPSGASRLLARRKPAGGMAADRVAGGRGSADQILALNASREHWIPSVRRYRQAALAHRARLPGAQAGDRPRSLRGAGLARLPPSRHTVHRRLRIPGLRAETIPPSEQPPPRSSRKLPFPKVIDRGDPPLRPNGTFQIRLRPFGED